jgi:hypothetical protein
MKIRKRSGPNTVPWGTSDVTSNCEADAKTLQKDLDTMQQWEAEWLMEFNPNKCEVITITNKRSHINYPYKLLLKVSPKYLACCTCTSSLPWMLYG